MTVNAVWAQQVSAPEGVKPLKWRLLTSQAHRGFSGCSTRGVRDDELRWRIEEYKAGQDGAGVQRQRLQSAGNLERIRVITAFIAASLLQLQERMEVEAASPEATPPQPIPLGPDEWRLLWLSSEHKKPLPNAPPSARWAYLALAKRGGFTDTKRTGRAGGLPY